MGFQPPVEAKPWDGIRDGSVVSDPCVQWRRFTNITFGKEDCLHVNVYTPLVNGFLGIYEHISTRICFINGTVCIIECYGRR